MQPPFFRLLCDPQNDPRLWLLVASSLGFVHFTYAVYSWKLFYECCISNLGDYIIEPEFIHHEK